MINLQHLDHWVLTVADMETTIAFYEQILGMKKEVFGDNRVALKFANQKINLHPFGGEFEPKAQQPTPGSADLCFLTHTPMSQIQKHLEACGVEVEEGPVQRTGATSPILSVYIRDPDKNLIEISTPFSQQDS